MQPITLEERNKMIEPMFEACRKALQRKGKDYSINGNAFAEFEEEASEILVDGKPITPEQAIWNHFKKHQIAIRNSANGATMQGDALREHCQDAANYLFLLCAYQELKSGAGRAVPVEELIQERNNVLQNPSA